MQNSKKITMYNLVFIALASVWGLGNIITGFNVYHGLRAITTGMVIFVFYFIPYFLMVSELGITFKNTKGGIAGWVKETCNSKVAYYAGWSYFIVHLPYIAQKPKAIFDSISWIVYGKANMLSSNVIITQICCLAILILAVYVVSKGIKAIKKVTVFAGASMLVSIFMFILMIFIAPVNGVSLQPLDFSMDSLIPSFDLNFFLGLCTVVFALGGCERISPYISYMENSEKKKFSQSMVIMGILIILTAILGTIALSLMINPNDVPKEFLDYKAYYAFSVLGEYFGVGSIFVRLFSVIQLIAHFAAIVIAIDAPIRILIEGSSKEYIPIKMFEQNNNGSYKNMNILVFLITAAIIVLPALNIKSISDCVNLLNSSVNVCMPLRYVWVFVAYIALKNRGNRFTSEFKFTRNNILGIMIGILCFAITITACFSGMIDTSLNKTILNAVTPVILVGIGMIFPFIARRENKK